MIDNLSIYEFYAKYPEYYNRLRFDVFRTKGYSCHYCNLEGTFVIVWIDDADDHSVHTDLFTFDENNRLVMMTIDHIIPKSKGGTKSLSNLITACQTCNNHKGDADYDEYIKRLDRKNLGVSEPQ